jgi:hypothetical protein
MMTFTNGEVEYRYLKALVDRDSTEASAALEEFASQLGNAAAAGGGGGLDLMHGTSRGPVATLLLRKSIWTASSAS